MKPLHYIYFFLLYATNVLYISQRKHWTYILRIIFVYLLMLDVLSTVGMVMQLQQKNNLFIFRIFTPLEYVLLALMYRRSLEGRFVQAAVQWSMYGFMATCILLTIFVENWLSIDSNAKTIETLLVTVWILIYFRQMLTSNKIINIYNDPMFWLNMGFLTYFIGTLFPQGLLNQLILQDKGLAKKLYSFQYLFEFYLFIQFNIALFCHRIFKVRVKSY